MLAQPILQQRQIVGQLLGHLLQARGVRLQISDALKRHSIAHLRDGLLRPAKRTNHKQVSKKFLRLHIQREIANDKIKIKRFGVAQPFARHTLQRL